MTGYWYQKGMGVILFIILLIPDVLLAATYQVTPQPGVLAATLAKAHHGDVLHLLAGAYQGNIVIDKSLVLQGEKGVVIKGNGQGSVITVKAPDVMISGLVITGSGLSLATNDSGIFLDKKATKARILNNDLNRNLVGIYVWGAKKSLVKGNRITGRRDLRMNERGNGIYVWNAPDTIIENNSVRYGRDGIFVTTSKKNIFRNNRFENLRFAIHYMYTNNSEVSGNISRNNHIGYAIMYSQKIKVHHNRSEHDRDRGILFNYANKVSVYGNIIKGLPHKTGHARKREKKCIFIYNSNKNTITGNLFSQCDIGIHFTAGSEYNQIWDNAFIANRTQVKYVGTRWLDWSHKDHHVKKGNYWSDMTGFDLNHDGIADAPYHPNDLTDQIIWRYPAAKLLLGSPALVLLKWIQSVFPSLHPGGVVDSAPLMGVPAHLRFEKKHCQNPVCDRDTVSRRRQG